MVQRRFAFRAALLALATCSNTDDPHGPATSGGGGNRPKSGAEGKPNILVWMMDDVGFGHASSFGGPVRTPNIDRVVARGLRYTNFHTTALCSPSRAAFLTGRNHHTVGNGKITELASDEPGYTGRIPKSAATFVEVLRQLGYQTYGLGKWHNTPIEEVSTNGPYDHWPTSLGFQHFYGFIGGDINNWAPTLWEDVTPANPGVGKADYHLNTDLADHAIRFLDDRAKRADADPFLLYFATGTAHAPHHAPKAFIDANKGRFDRGWDQVRDETFARQKQLGIMPKDAKLGERPSVIPAWDSLSADQKRLFARMQEVFAGALEQADQEFGRVLDELDITGQLDNTIVVVTSDNGASGEGGLEGSYNEAIVLNGLPDSLDANLKYIDKLGGPETYNHYPAGWALAGNTPGRYWKQTTHEGGVRDPLIIAWPKGIAAKGEIRPQFTHMVDLAPTLLELTGVPMPRAVSGQVQIPLEGASFVSSLRDAAAPTTRDHQYFEMFGNRGIWSAGWKAVTFHGRWPWDTRTTNPNFANDVWELYNLDADPNEVNDLAAKNPDKLTFLKKLFDDEAVAHHVFPLDDSTAGLIKQNFARLLDGRREFTYQGVTQRTAEWLSPPVKNHSHTITAKVTVPKGGADGVLATCGGRFGGYALYVKQGKLVYSHNYVAIETYTIASRTPVPEGNVELTFVFESTGQNKGHGRLYIDGHLVGEGDIPHTVPGAYSLGETFDTGIDTGTAVADYAVPFAYGGTLGEVKITIDDVPAGTSEAAPDNQGAFGDE